MTPFPIIASSSSLIHHLSVTALTASAPSGKEGLDLWVLIMRSFPGVVFWVLMLLVAFSLICWYIIGYKYFYLKRAQRLSSRFLDEFWQSKRLDVLYKTAEQMPYSPTGHVFRAGYIELTKLRSAQEQQQEGMHEQLGDMENVGRALNRAITQETTKLESMVSVLATTGSTAPFVGLFGTVWGIMNSFSAIGAKKSATLAVVAPGIAEALIATAIGLVAAIPAVIAYNYFVQRVKVLNSEMNTFASDFLNIVKRHFLK